MSNDFIAVETHLYLNWTDTDFKNGQKSDPDFWSGKSLMEITLVERANKFKPVYLVGLQDIFPSEADLTFGIKSIQWYLTACENDPKTHQVRDLIRENTSQLKVRTLIIRKDMLDPKINEKDIKEIYPYNFEVEDSTTYDQHILNADDGYAVLVASPSVLSSTGMRINFVYAVMDAKTGDWMGYVNPPNESMALGVWALAMAPPSINREVFRKLVEESNEK
jgi:hypothetical protein